MDRRKFLLTAAVVTPGLGATSLREERQALTIGGSIEAHVIVSAHSHEKSAESFRDQWIGQPFEGLGEFYRDSTEMRELPNLPSELIGTCTFHTTTIGVAAAKRDYLVGAFRRENLAFIVRIIGAHDATMMSIAEHFANQQLPTAFEILWSPIHLRKFIPDEHDLNRSVEESDSYWP